MKFLVNEVKPFIAKTHGTSIKQERSMLMGSSMGGLISWYGLMEYPDAFSRAASLSTHWPGIMTNDNNLIIDAFTQYIKQNLRYQQDLFWYMDLGDAELDAMYPSLQETVTQTLKVMSFPESAYVVKFFTGEGHNETAWRNRLDQPLTYLLGVD